MKAAWLLFVATWLSLSAPQGCAPAVVTPTIRGRVIDDAGSPVENVSVVALSVDMRYAGPCQTEADGTFALPVSDGTVFVVSLEAVEMDESTTTPDGVRAGAKNVTIVLHDFHPATFVVLDDRTGKPIERYGLGIANEPHVGTHGGNDMEELSLRAHPRGVVVTHAVVGRHVVRVQAPGFAPIEVPVAFDSAPAPKQTIRLTPGNSVSGRVLHAGEPLAGVSVVLVRGPIGSVRPGPGEVVEPDSWFFFDYARDVDGFLGRPRIVETDHDGAFRIADLASGTYDIQLAPLGLGPKRLHRVQVRGSDVDVGTMTIEAASALRAKVVLPPGVPMKGLKLDLDGAGRESIDVPADGSFVFTGLGAGLHRIALIAPYTVALAREAHDVRLSPGETKEVVFDLSAEAPLDVIAHVKRDGEPVKGVRVQALLDTSGRASSSVFLMNQFSLQEDRRPGNSRGTFQGTIHGGLPVSFTVTGQNGLLIARTAFEKIEPGAVREIEIPIDAGSLTLVLPADVEVPSKGTLDVTVERKGEQMQVLKVATGALPRSEGVPVWSGRRCDLGWLEPGDYDVHVIAFKIEPGDKEGAPETRIVLFDKSHNAVHVAPHSSVVLELSR